MLITQLITSLQTLQQPIFLTET